MAQAMPFRIGADASCTDGTCGQVSRVIVNPVAREVTHLIVDPKHRNGPGWLVPVDLVDAMTGQIRLHCTLAEFQTLRPAEETESVPDLDPTEHAHARVQKQHGVGGIVWSVRDPDAPQAPQEVTVDSVLAATVFAHESAAFGVHVLAGAGVDVRLSCRVGGRMRRGGWRARRWLRGAGHRCGPAGRRRGGRGTRRWRGGARPGRRAGGPGRPRRGS